MTETCWSLIRDDRIVKFEPIDEAAVGVRFDINWLRRHAAAHLHQHRMPIEAYQAIHNPSFGNTLHVSPEQMLFIYLYLEPVEAHYLLRLPLAPVMT